MQLATAYQKPELGPFVPFPSSMGLYQEGQGYEFQ
jgi:hypothetical protein